MPTAAPFTTQAQTSEDVIDRLLQWPAGHATLAVRHQRDKVVVATQGSYDGLFDAALPGPSLAAFHSRPAPAVTCPSADPQCLQLLNNKLLYQPQVYSSFYDRVAE